MMRHGTKKRVKPRKAPKKKLPAVAQECADKVETSKNFQGDALFSLRGSGRELWRDEHADEYVRRLREDWD
jgi:hypothetical protein